MRRYETESLNEKKLLRAEMYRKGEFSFTVMPRKQIALQNLTMTYCHQNQIELVLLRRIRSETEFKPFNSVIHLKYLGKMLKLGKWFCHDQTEANCNVRIDICFSLYSRDNISLFLHRLVTDRKEKNVFYRNKAMSTIL